MFCKIQNNTIKNEYGYYTIKNKPTQKELNQYYTKKYYQENKGAYNKSYTEEEIKYINNKNLRHLNLIREFDSRKSLKFLDIGCGEGFALNLFKQEGYDVLGLDYSNKGVLNHNPKLISNILDADIYESIDSLIDKKEKFNIIWMDNVLEHVLDPLLLLKKCHDIAEDKAIFLIEVPNDFSKTQLELKKKNIIKQDFWVAVPDHISYFNKEGLINIGQEAKWKNRKIITDFPIDFNLFNPDTNYITDATKGKGCHIERMIVSNLLHNISIEKTNKLFEVLADMGLGREIVGIFEKEL